jgi:hypothetical protein
MAKSSKNRTQKKETETGLSRFNLEKIIPLKYQTIAGIVFIFILFLIFFSPLYFQGKMFKSGDITAGSSFDTFKKTYEYSVLWNPYIFCGMPAQIAGPGYSRWYDIINTGYASIREVFGNIFHNDYAQHTVFLFLMAITAFSFMRSRKASPLVSTFVAASITFSTGLIVFLFIGHITKLYTLSMFPLVLMILLKFQNKIKLLDIILLIIACGFLLSGWHIQVIFYTYFAIGIYFLYFFIRFLIKKETKNIHQLLKSLGILIAATIIGFSTLGDMYAQIYEYTPFSTRGEKSIGEKESGKTATNESAFYDYATGWSFSPGEVLTFIVPSYYGFGNTVYNGSLSNNQDVDINTYFGQMRFVDVAMYMGVVVFFLGLFTMYSCRKDPLVQFLTILIVICLLISFGRNFSLVFDLMFYHFPLFNKFRVPSMILTMLQVSFPLLAGIGLMKIIALKNEREENVIKLIKYSAFLFTGFLVLSVLLNSVISSWFIQRVTESTQGKQLSQIGDFIADAFIKDLFIALFMISAVFWLSYAYIQKQISKDFLVVIIILLTVIDLFRISGRGAKFVERQDVKGQFEEPLYVKAIRNQNDKDPFRIVNLKQDGSLGSYGNNSNYNMYFLIQDLDGYSGIKPRAYQDYIDVTGPANPTLWRMLNVKYVVLDNPVQMSGLSPILTQDKTFVYKNLNALPRAFFVNRVESKSTFDILEAVKENKFDPKDVAYISASLNIDKPDSTASVLMENYGCDKITIKANASGNNLLFLGDTYYSKGWSALIDGKETIIYQADYGFRGIVVPRGVHNIEFLYSPKSYTIGKIISLIVNIFLLGGLAVGLFLLKKNKNEIIDD